MMTPCMIEMLHSKKSGDKNDSSDGGLFGLVVMYFRLVIEYHRARGGLFPCSDQAVRERGVHVITILVK